MTLKNKVIVITGASQGFGKALAQAFKQENAQVIISSYDRENLETTTRELTVDCFLADVTLFDNVKKLGEYVFKKYGKIDFWINNAGIQIAPSFVEEVNIEKLHSLFDVNFFGYFYGCQIALTYMKKQNNGVIMNINSTAGLGGKPKISAYTSSKFAIKGLTESIRQELKNSDIKIFGVFPGGMQTDIYKEKYPEDFKDYMKVGTVVEKVMVNLKSENPEIDLVIKRPSK
ncbi:MAG: SDR family oxidoreductase [Candidatus Woesearchaeota archaeon]|jgi:NADP-dependent 3-hydroxy acid dehydrogenase YdfG